MSPVVRLQKFLAEAGVASRRAAEQIILAGRVSVNGQPVRVLGTKVDPGHDAVTVDGKPVRARRKLYVALHKPAGCVCSRRDELGRPTIYDLLPKEWQNLHSVGRLDFNSEGLIFLTNDGQFALRLTHPRYGVRKKYVATVEGRVDGRCWNDSCGAFGTQAKNSRRRRRGSFRPAARAAWWNWNWAKAKTAKCGGCLNRRDLTVKRLQRTQIGKIKLGELKPGRWRTLTETEIKTLLAEI